MLPTLLGRWQTRILLFLVIGLPITIIYAFWLADASNTNFVVNLGGRVGLDIRPLQILCLLLIVGLVLDPLYYGIQTLRWDSDWPFSFQFFVSIVEFLIVLSLIELDLLPFVPASTIANATDYLYVTVHFCLVFIPSFLALLAFIQLFMIRWRFKGGEWGRL